MRTLLLGDLGYVFAVEKKTLPSLGSSAFVRTLNNVVFPAPFGPMIARVYRDVRLPMTYEGVGAVQRDLIYRNF